PPTPGTPVSRTVPGGKTPVSAPDGPVPNGSVPAGHSIPFDNTVIAAPAKAPIRGAYGNSCAMLPFCVASQPRRASSGSRSTCGLTWDGVLYAAKFTKVVGVPEKFTALVPAAQW